jgi:Peroxisomal biogenesis factor 11 (PEX11)
VQYFIKFIVPIIAARGAQHNDTKERLEKLQANMSLTRKVLRFGKPLPLVKAIMDRFKTHEKTPVRNILLRTISDLSLILYFISDHPLYFQRIGFVKLDKSWVDFIDYWNNIYWLVECLLDIYCDLCDLYYLNKDIQNLVNIDYLYNSNFRDNNRSSMRFQGRVRAKLPLAV